MADHQKHFIVIGGGAAGFFCAVNAARLHPSWRVTILEKAGRTLQKVKVSGGGRCNVTHDCPEISRLVKCYPRGGAWLKKAFHHFGQPDTVAWFAERGVRLKTEADGRMFPVTDNSQTIIDCLQREAEKFGVAVRLHSPVKSIARTDGVWRVEAGVDVLEANAVCVAPGGLPRPDAWEWIVRATGHQVVPPVPSLFTFNLPRHPICELMGVSVPQALIRIAGTKHESQGPVLITHWGLSGPAVLRTSAFAARDLAALDYRYTVIVNWLPAWHENSLREAMHRHRQTKGSQKVIHTEWIHLPKRLWEFLLGEAGIHPDIRWADLPAQQQNRLAKLLCAHELQAHGKTTFKEEFVTAGGIATSEVDPATMQSRLVPGIYFAGEVLDVDGITGGFNFQHAWTSGMIAARAIGQTP